MTTDYSKRLGKVPARRGRVFAVGTAALLCALFLSGCDAAEPGPDNPPGQPRVDAPGSQPAPPPPASPDQAADANSIGMAFVRVPAGSFLMGSGSGDPEAGARKSPSMR